MPQGIYLGVNDVARKIRSGYVGVNNIARAIRKAYIGISGVARPCFGAQGVEYYGTVSSLSGPQKYGIGASVGDYALLASNDHDGFDAYNSSLSKTFVESQTFPFGIAATFGSYAVFVGGYCDSTIEIERLFTAVDASLTATVRLGADGGTVAINSRRAAGASTVIGNYLLIGGGLINGANKYQHYDGSLAQPATEAYDSSFTALAVTDLDQPRGWLSATTVGGYAIFYGGCHGINLCQDADIYDESLTKIASVYVPTDNPVRGCAAATVGDYALFGGGDALYQTDAKSNVVRCNSSLTWSVNTSLSVARTGIVATSLGDYALFCGGICNDVVYGTVDAFTCYGTRVILPPLNTPRCFSGAATVGNYALFGGGTTDYEVTSSDIVDAYVYLNEQ